MNAQNCLIVKGCKLVMTCQACPEQYEVFFEGFQIGYLRLRGGSFKAIYPDVGGELVFTASPKGDGVFQEAERFKYLKAAVTALIDKHNSRVLDFQYDKTYE